MKLMNEIERDFEVMHDVERTIENLKQEIGAGQTYLTDIQLYYFNRINYLINYGDIKSISLQNSKLGYVICNIETNIGFDLVEREILIPVRFFIESDEAKALKEYQIYLEDNK